MLGNKARHLSDKGVYREWVLGVRLCPDLPNGTRVVINLSGRGDKDVNTAAKFLDISGE